MKVFIFGIQGNMGKRYASILKYLGHEAFGIDLHDSIDIGHFKEYDAYIIATPTHTHLQFLDYLVDCKRPVLCEKPFINNGEHLSYLEHFLRAAERSRMEVSMVSQYDYLIYEHSICAQEGIHIPEGLTYYNYYKHGSDGMAWDCINLIYHARGKIKLEETSPIWKCAINNHEIDIRMMDRAYVFMIRDWLDNPYIDQYSRILKSHTKVLDYLNGKFD